MSDERDPAEVRENSLMPALAELARRLGAIGDRPEDDEAQRLAHRFLVYMGVLMSFGTDNAGGSAADRVPMEIAALMDTGLSAEEIIETMTRNSAIYIGHEDELGTIEARKYADFLIVDGNPLEDAAVIGNVRLVVKEGVVVVDNR